MNTDFLFVKIHIPILAFFPFRQKLIGTGWNEAKKLLSQEVYCTNYILVIITLAQPFIHMMILLDDIVFVIHKNNYLYYCSIKVINQEICH